jgi:hypothetical protein
VPELKTLFDDRTRGYSTAELVVAIGLTSILALGSFYGIRITTLSHRLELKKAELINRHRETQMTIGKDIKHAIAITGSTSNNAVSNFVAIARKDSTAVNAFLDADPYDSVVIYKDLYPELWGGARVTAPMNGESYFKVYYVLENSASSPSDRDRLFQTAFTHAKYFFLVNTGARNIIENLDYGSTSTPQDESCPCPAGGLCPAQRCFSFRGGYHKSDGSLVLNPTAVLDISEVDRLDTNIRIGEKVSYEAGTSNCPTGSLCRIIDDDAVAAEEVLTNLVQLRTLYSFPPDPSKVTPSSAQGIRSPLDPSYLADLSAVQGGQSVTFADMASLKMTFLERLPSDLAKTIGPNSKETAFEYADGYYRYTSSVSLRPGFGIDRSSSFETGKVVDPECQTLQSARCNPSGRCNYLFTDPSATSPTSIRYQYNSANPSDFCKCGWNVNEHRFYDPTAAESTYKLPILNQTVYNTYHNSWVSNATAAGTVETGEINADRAMACARYTNCVQVAAPGTLIYRNPYCYVAKSCIHPDKISSIWSPVTGFDEAGIRAMVTASPAKPSELYCASGGASNCDAFYGYSQGTAAPTYFRDFCACTTRVWTHYIDATTPDLTRPLDVSWSLLDSDSLCRLPGARKTCDNTWDAPNSAWVIQDAAHPQGLSTTTAELCSCRRNLKADSSPNISSDFAALSAYAGNAFDNTGQTYVAADTVPYQFGHNSVGMGYNQTSDFRVDNPEMFAWLKDPTHLDYNPYFYNASQAGKLAANNPPPITPPAGTAATLYKYGSYLSQHAPVKISTGGVLSDKQVVCSAVQASWSTSANYRVPGQCIETAHPSGTNPANWPTTNAGVAPGTLWNHYRWFCTPLCGIYSAPTTPASASYPFNVEVNYIRSKIREAATEVDRCAAWCPDLFACTTATNKVSPPITGGQ